MSSTQGTSKDNLPVLQLQKACAHDSCSFSRNSTPHFHCPYCGIGARKKPNIVEHVQSKHGDMTTRAATSEGRQSKEEEAEKAEIKDGVTVTKDKKKAKGKKKRKRKTDDHNDSEEEKEATAEHQGKLAKEYPLTVSLPKDCNDDQDEKDINRIKGEYGTDSNFESEWTDSESEMEGNWSDYVLSDNKPRSSLWGEYELVFSREEESEWPDVGEEDIDSLHHTIQEDERTNLAGSSSS